MSKRLQSTLPPSKERLEGKMWLWCCKHEGRTKLRGRKCFVTIAESVISKAEGKVSREIPKVLACTCRDCPRLGGIGHVTPYLIRPFTSLAQHERQRSRQVVSGDDLRERVTGRDSPHDPCQPWRCSSLTHALRAKLPGDSSFPSGRSAVANAKSV